MWDRLSHQRQRNTLRPPVLPIVAIGMRRNKNERLYVRIESLSFIDPHILCLRTEASVFWEKCGIAPIRAIDIASQYKKLLIKIRCLSEYRETRLCCDAKNNQSPYAG